MRGLLWLMPGLGVKRWLAVFTVGLAAFGLGTVLAVNPARLAELDLAFRSLIHGVSGGFPPARIGGLLLIPAGLGLIQWSLRRTFTLLWSADPGAAASGRGRGGETDPAAALLDRRRVAMGPGVVAIGGGTGLATLLRGLKHYTDNITAIVTVTDDGGSSGRLRRETGILPPGDVRQVIAALAEAEPLMESLFQHRFTQGGLAGHSFGNLFILAMSELLGDFEEAVKQSSKVLAVRGEVVPLTLDAVDLVAIMDDGSAVRGETAIAKAPGTIVGIGLDPPDPEPLPRALAAIEEADLIIMGPGSLYTSILPGLLAPRLAAAISRSSAPRVFIVNVMTQPGETDGYTASRHVAAVLANAASPGLVDWALVNSGGPRDAGGAGGGDGADSPRPGPRPRPVAADVDEIKRLGVRVYEDYVAGRGESARHDSHRLARAVFKIMLMHGTGGLSRGRGGRGGPPGSGVGRKLLRDMVLADRLARNRHL